MSKAVLISIRPEWCELIALGAKTIEIRKTNPKLETPFKVYIYCTEPKRSGDIFLVGGEHPVQGNGKVVGEFICDNISVYEPEFYEGDNYYQEIKMVLEDEDGVNYKYITSNKEEDPEDCDLCGNSCLTFDEIKKYIGKERFDFYFYGWHISDLVIYDEPRELSYFCKPVECPRGLQKEECVGCWDCEIKRPPQSWCYVEDSDNV